MKELVDATMSYLTDRNQHPEPCSWKMSGTAILAKVDRAIQALAGIRKRLICGDLNLSWTVSGWPGILTTTANYEIKWRGHIAL